MQANEIKDRKKVVELIQKICSAMKSVSISKMKSGQEEMKKLSFYTKNMNEISTRIVKNLPKENSHLNDLFYNQHIHSDFKRVLMVFSTDSGLCGSFFGNCASKVEKILSNVEYDEIFVMGKKMFNFIRNSSNGFRKSKESKESKEFSRKYKFFDEVISSHWLKSKDFSENFSAGNSSSGNLSGNFDANGLKAEDKARKSKSNLNSGLNERNNRYDNRGGSDTINVHQFIVNEFSCIVRLIEELNRRYDNNFVITVVFTEFHSMNQYELKNITFNMGKVGKNNYHSMEIPEYFENISPDLIQNTFFMWIHSYLYNAYLSNYVSENSSRFIVTENAFENSNEIIKDLNVKYNQIRQANITESILNIVSSSVE